MNRRTALRNVVLISAGASLLPSCLHDDKPGITLKNIKLNGSQEKLLEELTETILPKTNNFTGAKDLKSHEFILIMADDCSSPEDQKKFKDGMDKFDEACKKKFNIGFVKCSPAQRKEWLQLVEKKTDMPEDLLNFYGAVKQLTIQSFTSSKDFLLNIRKFKLAPGPVFKGCVPVGKA
jgi:hypothetical protein